MASPKRALVVDDQETIRDLVAEILQGYGFETVVTQDGSKAEEILRRDRFDLLITDLLMPDMDGIQLIINCRHNLKSQTSAMKIIAMSGGGRYHSGEFYLNSASRLGADLILAKPFTIVQLTQSLEKLGFNVTANLTNSPPQPPTR